MKIKDMTIKELTEKLENEEKEEKKVSIIQELAKRFEKLQHFRGYKGETRRRLL